VDSMAEFNHMRVRLVTRSHVNVILDAAVRTVEIVIPRASRNSIQRNDVPVVNIIDIQILNVNACWVTR
jgi:hypothetical protein